MIEITRDPIDTQAVLQSVQSPLAGAVVLFLGTVREITGDTRTKSLYYECYVEMAQKQLAALEAKARDRWPLIECATVHRLGRLGVSEVSVAIGVSSAHRKPAFEAGQWMIDRIKEVVPIWKQENDTQGESAWVHPDQDAPATDQEM